MTDLRTRDVTESDLPAILAIRNRSFGPLGIGGQDWWRRVADETLGGRMLAVVDGDDTILGAGRARPFEQAWGGGHLRMGGVAGVYVEPSARGRGVASLLGRALITRMAELGDVVSCLFPTTATLYRGVGYEIGGVQSRVTYAAHDLRHLRTVGGGPRPRPAGPADAERLHALARSAQERHRQSGPMVPSVAALRHALQKDDLIHYLVDDGFVTYSLSEEALTVEHLVAGSPESAAALWAVVGSGSSATPIVRTYMDPRDPVRLLVGGLPELEVSEHVWMARVIDLAAAMAGRGFSSHVTASARITVSDHDCPGCDGTWQIDVSSGRGAATRTSSTTTGVGHGGAAVSAGIPSDRGEAGGRGAAGASPAAYGTDGEPVRMGSRGLAGLWCGWTMSRLRQAGLVEGGSVEDDAALDAVFACSPYITEYF